MNEWLNGCKTKGGKRRKEEGDGEKQCLHAELPQLKLKDKANLARSSQANRFYSICPSLSFYLFFLSPLLCTALHWTAVINYAFPAAEAAAAKAAEAMLHSSPQSSVETKEEEEGLNFVYTVSGTIACHYCHSFKWLRSVRAQTQTETDGDTGRQWRGIEALGVQH